VDFADDAEDEAFHDELQGWLDAMGTLGHERVGTSGLAIGMRAERPRR
jgi:hypothetical protein